MLPSPVAAQGVKAVAWKTRKIGEGDGCVEYFQSFPALPIKALERPHQSPLANSSVRLSLKLRIIEPPIYSD